MAKKDDARDALATFSNRFQKKLPRRIAYMGDGRGLATSNLVVPDNNAYVYVRDQLSSKRYYTVRMNRNVRPAFNIPVEVERLESGEERIVDVADTFIDYQQSASVLIGTQPHANQHMFGGGDEVFVDDFLIKSGLVSPTDPVSMSVDIFSFVYYRNEWKRFPISTSDDLSKYKPPIGSRYVLLAVDTDTNSLLYVPGEVFTATFSELLTASDGFEKIPSPPGDVIPLAAVLLTPTTTAVDWRSVGTDNLVSMRIFLSSPQKSIEERLRQLEGYLGNNSDLPATGAQGFTTDDNYVKFIDGGTW